MGRGWLSAINRRRVWTVAVEAAGRGSSESGRGADEKPKDGFCWSRKQAAAVLSQKCYQTLSPLLLNGEKKYIHPEMQDFGAAPLWTSTHYRHTLRATILTLRVFMPICRHCMTQLCKAGGAAELGYVHLAAVILSNQL